MGFAQDIDDVGGPRLQAAWPQPGDRAAPADDVLAALLHPGELGQEPCASDLAIDLPHRLAGRARTASGYTRIPRRQHHGSHHWRPLPPGHPCPLNTAAPPRRECARRGLDPIPPPNREDRTMTETVDQAQAQPPRALAGIIEDALRSPPSRLAIWKDRGVAASPHGDAVLRQSVSLAGLRGLLPGVRHWIVPLPREPAPSVPLTGHRRMGHGWGAGRRVPGGSWRTSRWVRTPPCCCCRKAHPCSA
jgi:hypothetical protein